MVARVKIGQPLLSIRIKPQHIAAAQEALRRAKFKFPGRQKIFISRKWGFTKFDKEEFQQGLQSGHIITDGVAQHKGKRLKKGDSWGAEDVLLHRHSPERCLHALSVAGVSQKKPSWQARFEVAVEPSTQYSPLEHGSHCRSPFS